MENERLKSVRDSASAKCWPSKAPPLNVELMRDWTEEDAKRYFESGGLFFPASMATDGGRRLYRLARQGRRCSRRDDSSDCSTSKNVSATSDGSTSNTTQRRLACLPFSPQRHWRRDAKRVGKEA